uniref:Uncharacterized protein n=2 Tax=Anopheles merus TaxID=30066 RepID=A0A182UW16_ANOME
MRPTHHLEEFRKYPLSETMNCFKCSCGCDKLSKEELELIINSSDRVKDFLKNETARSVFRRLTYPDEDESQPSGSKQRPVGKRPKPKAIKYLELIEKCEELMKKADLSDEAVEELAKHRDMDMELAKRLDESTAANRTEVLEAIVREYSNRLCETECYEKFISKLVKAHAGKLNIEK